MKNKQLILSVTKRLLFTVLIIAAYLMQFTIIPRTGISFSLFLLIPVISAISMHENEIPAALFGFFCGALWDMASPVTDGTFALIFTLLSCLVSLLTRYLIRNTHLTAIIFSTAYSLICCITVQLFFIKDITSELFSINLTESFIPSVISAVALSAPCYTLIKKISELCTKT